MEYLRRAFEWTGHHWTDILLAALFGVLFAIVADFVQPASRIRAGIRYIRNKLAERSVASLDRRIRETEAYKARVESFRASAKAHYLATLQLILAVLVFMSAGMICFLMDRLQVSGPGSFGTLALGLFEIALVIGVYAISMASWDTDSKLAAVIAKLDGEIAGLERARRIKASPSGIDS